MSPLSFGVLVLYNTATARVRELELIIIKGKRRRITPALTVPLLALMPGTATARSQPTPTELAVRQADAAFWTAFNRCDQGAMAALFTSDAEFYHDKTGLKAGRLAVASSMMRGPCATRQKRIRREAIEESIRFDPLAGGFALFSGEHRFLETKAGEPERPSGMARFTSVWQQVGARWQMRRVASYDHGPERVKLVPVVAPSQALRHGSETMQWKAAPARRFAVLIELSRFYRTELCLT